MSTPWRGQGDIPLAAVLGIGLLAVELHEDEIPDLQEAVVLCLQQLGMIAVVALLRILVPVDFGMWVRRGRYRPFARS